VKRATFIIPKADNEGQRFPTATVARLRREILENLKGYTVREVKGGWIGEDGKTYQDESWEYTVVTDEEQVGWLVGFLKRARETLRQEAMYLVVTEVEAQLIR
jgi:hypothetical protein